MCVCVCVGTGGREGVEFRIDQVRTLTRKLLYLAFHSVQQKKLCVHCASWVGVRGGAGGGGGSVFIVHTEMNKITYFASNLITL